MSEHRLLTFEQAAKVLGIRWVNVRELVETGQLRAVKIGTRYRIPPAALDELGKTPEVGQSSGTILRRAWGGTGWHGASERSGNEFKTAPRGGSGRTGERL